RAFSMFARVRPVAYGCVVVITVDHRHVWWTVSTKLARVAGVRKRGVVRPALVEAGFELARAGGPGAVVLREATRMVGVVPNAAYRHFRDRDALLATVRDRAIGELARRMADGMGAQTDARLRLRAVGEAYLAFAREEPGLFDTAFAATEHPQ